MQLLINILISSSTYLLICFSFKIIYETAKFFHIAHACFITLGAYFTYLFSVMVGLNLFLSILCAIIMSTLLGISLDLFIYRPLRSRETSSWKLLITSLGVYIVIQNIISMIWGDDTKNIRTWPIVAGHKIFNANITTEQIILIIVNVLLVVALLLYLKYHKFGKQIRAVSINEELSTIFGLNVNRLILLSFGIGSFLCSIAGILLALDTNMVPTMGFNVLIFSVVVMIIGGLGNYKGIIASSILFASIQHLSAYYISSQWMNGISYLILILFLIWKPLGFSGVRIKKVDL